MENPLLSIDQFESFDFRELPIGVYMTSLDGQFIICNRTLRKMLGLPLDGPVKANIEEFYAEKADRSQVIQQAIQLARQGKIMEREILHLKVSGRNLHVEDYCSILQNEDGNVTGFVGCLVDITDEHENKIRERELQNRVEELTIDIGSILHSNTTTLVMVMQSLNSVVQAFSSNPFLGDSVPSPEEIDAALTEYANHLASAIERVGKTGDEERRSKALSESKWKVLLEQVEALRNFKERIPVAESRSVSMRVVAHYIGQIYQSIASGFLPREPLRDLQQLAWHLERLATLIDVLKTRSAVLQMDFTLHSLREYITADKRETSKRSKIPIERLIDESISRLTAFAQSSRVEIKKSNIVKAKVNVNPREVSRALSNLLHNAIKYTWRRDRTSAPWVTIYTRIHDSMIFIEFENWGVPVSREEIEMGLVFKLGYRGKWSTDRGRLGTGIGLTDSRRVAEFFGGGVSIESRPTRSIKDDDPNYYTQPFITKVAFFLPLEV